MLLQASRAIEIGYRVHDKDPTNPLLLERVGRLMPGCLILITLPDDLATLATTFPPIRRILV
jgi:hypothetical protein